MSGMILQYNAPEIYILGTTNKIQELNMDGLFVSPAGRELMKQKSQYHHKTKMKHTNNDFRKTLPTISLLSETSLSSLSSNQQHEQYEQHEHQQNDITLTMHPSSHYTTNRHTHSTHLHSYMDNIDNNDVNVLKQRTNNTTATPHSITFTDDNNFNNYNDDDDHHHHNIITTPSFPSAIVNNIDDNIVENNSSHYNNNNDNTTIFREHYHEKHHHDEEDETNILVLEQHDEHNSESNVEEILNPPSSTSTSSSSTSSSTPSSTTSTIIELNTHDTNFRATQTSPSTLQDEKKLAEEYYEEELELLLGLNCVLEDDCRCFDCQSSYFDYTEDDDLDENMESMKSFNESCRRHHTNHTTNMYCCIQ